ncbi:protein translocase subunit SecF [Rhodovibrio sodomensis]|uniref:Protein-export membrane protein SecF n=1 Tax=Rhodovibrio sodomensis TaxID=1088 RepID=A0ABS1DG40_9PROT|nr:protein translocase subunit SecF [Rhodovibrio sodomensis]MBK1668360.1 protein translocase subunit SecF [Rhodovibrio sodomensis]
MALVKRFPIEPRFDFAGKRRITLGVSTVLMVLSIIAVGVLGLNLGVDFRGGIVMEIQTKAETADVQAIRSEMNDLGLGDVTIQRFGEPNVVRLQVQEQEGGAQAQQAAIERIRNALDARVAQWRRVEFVGPAVGEELKQAGMMATGLALLAMALYIWFRFEWQFAAAGLSALVHDLVLTLGFFAVTQLEFNLGTVAAVLTIAGYSINDTVVIFDRVREILRKYKRKAMPELINLSLNSTLTRTLLTSGTTLIALFALAIFGGTVIRSFTWALIFGVAVGTYSSVGFGTPLLMLFGVKPSTVTVTQETDKEAAARVSGQGGN